MREYTSFHISYLMFDFFSFLSSSDNWLCTFEIYLDVRLGYRSLSEVKVVEGGKGWPMSKLRFCLPRSLISYRSSAIVSQAYRARLGPDGG